MSLERPRAEMTMRNGALVVMTAATAMYQSQAQLLDLFDDVNLVHENGTHFVTKTAHVDVAADTRRGQRPGERAWPFGRHRRAGLSDPRQGRHDRLYRKVESLAQGDASRRARPRTARRRLPPEVAEAAAALEAAAVRAGPAPRPNRPLPPTCPRLGTGRRPAARAAPATPRPGQGATPEPPQAVRPGKDEARCG